MNFHDHNSEQLYDVRSLTGALMNWLHGEFKGLVQTGPFAGVYILPEISWPSTAFCPILLGCYEMELHPYIECEISRLQWIPKPKIVNIGCAEGYYALGMARRLPNAEVWAVDNNIEALHIMEKAVQSNNVKMVISSNEKMDEVLDKVDFVISDCEGAEVDYLDPEKFPALKKAGIIVEIHYLRQKDGSDPPAVDEILVNRFKDTHRVSMVYEGGRNPSQYPILHMLSSHERWLAVSERRDALMHWLCMSPK